ncbi:MAG: IS66 family insertion sequence element accessory protein TnpB [Ruminococcus sp.]|nr:IS66 family insertion sequence element accessory protein TnpB [Ruminococcus sp.]
MVTGYTDLRRSIDGLAEIFQGQLHLDPFSTALFLFCGRRRDRIKGLLWKARGFCYCIRVWRMHSSVYISRTESHPDDCRGLCPRTPEAYRRYPVDCKRKQRHFCRCLYHFIL